MPVPMIAGLPPDLDLGDAYTIRFAAIDAATGAAVTGVTVSAVSIFAAQLSGPSEDVGPFRLVPGPSSS